MLRQFYEKYAIQNKVNQINELAKIILKRVEYVSKEFLILDSDNKIESDYRADYLYAHDKEVLDLFNDMYEEGEAVVFKENVSDILDGYNIKVVACIVDYDTNQTGGLDTFSRWIRVYFSLPQFKSKKNNYNLVRLKKTLMHEITHLHDIVGIGNNYYSVKAQKFISSDLREKEINIINNTNPYIFDILYRLWNDSEMNAQQITITNDLVDAIKNGLQTLKTTNSEHEIFITLKEILSRYKYHNPKHDYSTLSNDKFKRWFIENSEKRLKKLLDKKLKNDYLLNNR